ncbi:PREDICTED: synaptotagmin-3-like [Ipomoea nil]|uniref:synaptotagmin-3-like n=1 Tax=Ipomoea nil TaxID=35883 RepID=UPI00090200D2|nr:PREDICTED: synaptotagmin-3-like [Ipomoea nil]XP_019154994.1 PREDICTED: synaptotagmin-3-like [Ipomoea nil]
MGFLRSVLVIFGFWLGIPIGLVIGYLLFICYAPKDDVNKDPPECRSLQDFDSSSFIDLFSELPSWVMNPDFERVEWLNLFIEHMWPYLDKAVCGIVRSTTQPIFAEYSGKYLIKSIEFEHLTLGTFTPKIHGIKSVKLIENQLIFELALRWAGNPNIVIALKLLCLKIPVQLIEFQISARLRVILSPLLATFPCFSSILVSLMEKPNVDFGLKVLGGDLMAIPGLHHYIQETVSKEVSKLYLWPQTLEIPVLDSSVGAVKRPVGILHVKVLRARNLIDTDVFSKSDPYVTLNLGKELLSVKKTTVKMDTLDPVWNEDFKLTVKDPDTQVLELHLYDWEKFGTHDNLGMQVVPLKLLKPYEKKTFTLDLVNSMNPNDPLNNKSMGQIEFEMTFVPFQEDSMKFTSTSGKQKTENIKTSPDKNALEGEGLLSVTIKGADDVEGKVQTNPYVVIHFRGEERKTKKIKKCRHPRWEEEFQFVLEEVPLKDHVHIEVMSVRRRARCFRTKESLGYVDIQLRDVVHNGRVNEEHHLINSKNGTIHVDIRWKVI